MANNKDMEYSSEISKVRKVQFSIMSPDEIRRRSVVEVTTDKSYSGMVPVVEGLFDTRMGVLDEGLICPTDKLNSKMCPGYFGHIELARPVFHIHFIETVRKILHCICYNCGNLLITERKFINNLIKKKSKGRWDEIFSHITGKLNKGDLRCGDYCEHGCGKLQPKKYVRSEVAKISGEWENKDTGNHTTYFYADYVLRIFRKLSDKDCEILGFNTNWAKPEWMICQVLPVPPPAVRPSVQQDNNQRKEDDLTHKLTDIIKKNDSLRQKIQDGNNEQRIIDDYTDVLQFHVATLIDNEIPGIPPAAQRTGRPLKSVIQRLKTKEGRIRGNLMGKRVDFSARSVITPDPNIDINELGVPYEIAMNLTYPDIVTPYNIDICREYVKNGPDAYPGAKSVKQNGRVTSLKYGNKDDIKLNYGDVINRHLINGDVVLFNRQPSLHKMSMMAHRVKVMPFSTFRLNVSVTSPYNADFDGRLFKTIYGLKTFTESF
jgi:DNA-directed RNA polymerase II subunit RPB1